VSWALDVDTIWLGLVVSRDMARRTHCCDGCDAALHSWQCLCYDSPYTVDSLTDLSFIGIIQCESKITPLPDIFVTFFPKRLGIFSPHAYYTFLSTLDYKFLFNYLHLWRSYAILIATTTMCSKCPPSTETHAGWSHLIWHNIVTVGDTWIQICILAYVWTFNRRVKFGLKFLIAW